MIGSMLEGDRFVIEREGPLFPESLRSVRRPPRRLFVVGNPHALEEGLAVIGARHATPYGRGCAARFSRKAAERGIVIVSGGARGCDAEAHRAAVGARSKTVVFLGGGCDRLYPSEHRALFQSVIDAGGAIASEHEWGTEPRPYMFRERNRLIAGLARVVLIVEAGMPSGTFSTADEALEMGKTVLVVPGAITSAYSRGSNRLLYDGAVPVIDDETFEDQMAAAFGLLRSEAVAAEGEGGIGGCASVRDGGEVLGALSAEPLSSEELCARFASRGSFDRVRSWIMEETVKAEACGLIARQPDGRWAAVVRG